MFSSAQTQVLITFSFVFDMIISAGPNVKPGTGWMEVGFIEYLQLCACSSQKRRRNGRHNNKIIIIIINNIKYNIIIYHTYSTTERTGLVRF